MRLVRTPGGQVVLDETGRLAGRGAYLCADGSCWTRALDKGTLQRALETPLPEDLKARLRAGAAGLIAATASAQIAVRHPAEPTKNVTSDEMTRGEPIGQE